MTSIKRDTPDAARSTLPPDGSIRQPIEPPTVLVVDHDEAVRDSLSRTLHSGGFSVLAYGSAKELLGKASIKRDSCLLIEHDLKDMTGIELLARINARLIERPAIIMSARLRPLILEDPRPPSVVAILQKPFGRDALLRCLWHALGRH